MRQFELDALVLPSVGELHSQIPCHGGGIDDCASYAGWVTKPSAIAGYPIVTVPLGFQPDDAVVDRVGPLVRSGPGMPFGVSFLGTAFSEFTLIRYAYAFEHATMARLQRRAYDAAVPRTQLADVM